MWSKAILAFSLVFLAGCGLGEEKPQASAGATPPPSKVDVITIQKGQIPLKLEYPAKIRSAQHVEVRAKVSGTLLKQHYVEGELVKAGAPLFQIDPAKFQARVKEASAQLLLRQAMLEQSEREWKRIERLFEEKAVSEKQRDDTLAAYEIARANVSAAEAALDSAKIDLDYTTITAPSSGIAGMKAKDIGAFINAAGDSLMTTITQLDPIHVEFAIPDLERLKQTHSLQKGAWSELNKGALQAVILFSGGEAYGVKGVVDFIDSRVDEATGSVKARATFKNSEKWLMPGQFVRLQVEGIVQENGSLIPQESLMQSPQGAFVYTVQGDKAVPKPVKILHSTTKEFVVVGLESGDVVVVNNLTKIRPGASVQVDRRN